MKLGRLIVLMLGCTFFGSAITCAQQDLYGRGAISGPHASNGAYEAQRRQYLEGLSQYPALKQKKIDEVYHLHVEDGALAVDTPLEADHDYQQHRADLEGLSEPAVILCWYISQDLGQVQFELNLDDYSDPRTFGRLHVLARPLVKDKEKAGEPQSIDIVKNWQTLSGSRQLFYNQANGWVRLVITDAGAGGMVNIDVAEKDFVTLRRNHPAETETYLRPVMRELHQESVFAADPATAWQVLSPVWPVDAKLATTMTDKIKALDNDDFRVRRRAADDIQGLGRDAALVLMKMDRTQLTVEQDLWMDEVIGRFKTLSEPEAARLARDPNFLLDCLYGQDAMARNLALHRLREITGKPIEFDLDAPEAARVKAVNELRPQLRPTESGK